MKLADFDELCTDASDELGLEDARALGLGGDAMVEGVLFEIEFFEGQDAFLVLADLGAVAQEDKLDVYQTLLAMQLQAWDQPSVRFGFHPLRDAAVLCVGAAAPQGDDGGAWLAGLLKSVASQVNEWRGAQLKGKLTPRESENTSVEEYAADGSFAPEL